MAITLDKIDRLKGQLLTSGLQLQNPALYQIINQLIGVTKQLIEASNSNFIDNSALEDTVNSILAAHFITSIDMSSLLPNSRELLAGFNILIDNSVAGETTISQVVADINNANDIFFPPLPFFQNPYCPCGSEEN